MTTLRDAGWEPGTWTLVVDRDDATAERTRLAAWGHVERPGKHNIETNLADARLIAAAPDLLVALNGLYMEHAAAHPSKLCACVHWRAAREAIAKATGQ